MNSAGRKILFLLALAVVSAFALRLVICSSDIIRLVQACVADDAFYYFKIAKNIAAGFGVTYDRLAKTNGFHPLYMAILVPVFKIFGNDPVTPIRIALVCISIFNVFTAVFIYKIIKRVCGSVEPAIWGAVFFLFNPFTVFVSLTGVEAAIATFFMSASTYVFVMLKEKESPAVKDNVVLGLLVGLALLARTDSIIFCGFILIDRFFCAVKNFKSRKSDLAGFIVLNIVILAVVSPWLIWNIQNFYSIRQASGKIISFTMHELLKSMNPGSYYLALRNKMFNLIEKQFFTLVDFLAPLNGPREVRYGALAVILMSFTFYLTKEKMWKRYLGYLHPAFLTLAGVFFFYTSLFLYRQTWYFMSSFFIASLVFGPAIAQIIKTLSLFIKNRILRSAFFTGAAAVIVLSVTQTYLEVWRAGFNPWQSLYVEVSRYIEKELPPGARVGAFNSGIVSYFTDKEVINLDGVVNNEIYEVFKNKKLMSYIREKRIDYVVDHAVVLNTFEHFSDASLYRNFTEVKRFKLGGFKASDILLLKIKTE